MAHMECYSTNSQIAAAFRHNERDIQNPTNVDIDHNRTKDNYQIGIIREHPFEYYKQRMSEVYCYKRPDVKKMVEWIVTLPKDCPRDQEHSFFQSVYDFMCDRWVQDDGKSVIGAWVHTDEKKIEGRESRHMHVDFIPIVKDPKHEQGYKICKSDFISRSDLRTFHQDLQKYLKEKGIGGSVYTGITAQQQRNYSVREIKNGVRNRVEAEAHARQQEEPKRNFFTQKPMDTTVKQQHQEEEQIFDR